jgi:hypothetical protein
MWNGKAGSLGENKDWLARDRQPMTNPLAGRLACYLPSLTGRCRIEFWQRPLFVLASHDSSVKIFPDMQ